MYRGFRDLLAWLFGWKPAVVVLGPSGVEAGEVFVTGRSAGLVYSTGPAAGQLFTTGATRGQIYG
jgi:hypothetical protein